MAIAFVAAGALADGSAGVTSLTVGKPAGIASGQLALVHIAVVGLVSNIIAPPDNSWYQLPLQDNITTSATVYNLVFWHTITNSEPTWTFTLSANLRCVARSVAYSGVGSFSALGVADSAGVAGTTATAPAVNSATATGNVLLQFIYTTAAVGNTVTLDGALTSRYNSISADNANILAMGEDASPTNPSAAYANTISASKYWCIPVVVLHNTGSLPNTVSDYGVSGVGATTQTGLTVSSITINVPAGVQDGDFMLSFIRLRECSSTITPPAGWATVRADFSTSGARIESCGVYSRTASSEPASYTWNVTTGTAVLITGTISLVRGVSAIETTTATIGNGITGASTPYTPLADNEVIVYGALWSTDGGGSTIWSANVQREPVGAQGVSIFSALSGKAGDAVPAVTFSEANSISDSYVIYTVAFTPASTSVSTGPTYLGSAATNTFTGSSQALTVPTTPSATAAGDVLIAHVVVGTGITITPPSGWALITSASADDGVNKASAYWHSVAAGDAATATFTFSGSTTGCGSITAFRNAAATFLASNGTTSGSTPALGSIPAGYAVLMYQMTEHTGGQGTAGNTILTGDIECLPTLLVYTNASTALGGAVSFFPHVGPIGSQVGLHSRSVSAGGPSLTIAMATAPGAVLVKGVVPRNFKKVRNILQAQKQQKQLKRSRWSNLLQKLTGVPPAGGTGLGTVAPPPTPTPTFTSGIRQDLWLKVTPGTVYRITVLKTRIHDSED